MCFGPTLFADAHFRVLLLFLLLFVCYYYVLFLCYFCLVSLVFVGGTFDARVRSEPTAPRAFSIVPAVQNAQQRRAHHRVQEQANLAGSKDAQHKLWGGEDKMPEIRDGVIKRRDQAACHLVNQLDFRRNSEASRIYENPGGMVTGFSLLLRWSSFSLLLLLLSSHGWLSYFYFLFEILAFLLSSLLFLSSPRSKDLDPRFVAR